MRLQLAIVDVHDRGHSATIPLVDPRSHDMLRFAVLTHDYPSLHWDFLLENGEKCRTWRLPNAPDAILDETIVEEIADHRLLYLDYEGPVSGQRGSVTQWDCGTFKWLKNEADQCLVLLEGQHWRGRVHLLREQGAKWVCRHAQ